MSSPKNKLRDVRKITVLLGIQFLILTIFGWLFSTIEFANNNNTANISFVATDIDIPVSIRYKRITSGRVIHIYSSSNKYYFLTRANTSPYSRDELLTEILNDELHITYLLKTNKIVAMHNDQTVFYTTETYNARKLIDLISGILLFLIVETIFVVVFIIYIRIFSPRVFSKRNKQFR